MSKRKFLSRLLAEGFTSREELAQLAQQAITGAVIGWEDEAGEVTISSIHPKLNGQKMTAQEFETVIRPKYGPLAVRITPSDLESDPLC